MQSGRRLAEDIWRYILSVPSVPYIEAVLLLHREASHLWSADLMARHLYLSASETTHLLAELSQAGICASSAAAPDKYFYQPETRELADLIDRVAVFYSQNLIEATNIIHARARAGKKARTDPESAPSRKEK